MRIRVAVQNLNQGGLTDGNGHTEDRWPRLKERIEAAAPDVLLLNEARGWTANGHQQLGRAQRDLGMYAAPLPSSKTGMLSAVLFRPDTMGFWVHASDDLGQETTHGFLLAAFEIAGLPVPLTFAANHVDPYSGDRAIYETKLVATRAYRYGPLAVVGGDQNFPPEDGPEPDYAEMRPYNLAARTLLDHPDGVQPDRRAARMMKACGYADVAWHMYQATGDKQLLRRTASDDRIDRIHVSNPLASALSNYQLLDEPAGASDHHGIAVDIDTEFIDLGNLWSYR